jgi:hypothetical protein
VHRELKDAIRETEDLRILAVAVGIAGKAEDAEQILHDVVARATEQARPLLVAIAQRDLAYLLARSGQVIAAKEMARSARATFHRLGSKVEIEKMDALLAQPHFGTPELGRSEPANAPADRPDAIPTRDLTIPRTETPGPA